MREHNFGGRVLLLDSNLSVLLCVGSVGIQYIARHKRLAAFDETDFMLLTASVVTAARLLISPNIATETSNLLRQVANPLRDQFSRSLMQLVNEADEQITPSRQAIADESYIRLGLTDAAILHIVQSDRKVSLLTTDLDLYLAAAQRDLSAVNFNHLKQQRPDLS